ncbi:MAG: response regulator [Parcubacteria group bacterium]|nr:response regulator [Parcubacteria group bacterium]
MDTQKKKILIVDDNKDLRGVLVNALHAENLTVLEAGNGEEGLALALAEHPDMILLDIVMPKMDGVTMLQKLRKDKWGRDAWVTMLTNLTDAEKVHAAMEEGVYDFLAKSDWALEDLLSKIRLKLNIPTG